MEKSLLSIDGDRISVAFNFTKVDKRHRTVTGIATADNVDLEGDIIESNASKEAFAAWVGNIREMHGNKAVGKAVSSRSVLVKDNTGQEYNGVEVTVYISKGAQDTWEKILDGTLTGFSVGGRVLEKVKELHKATSQIISRIKKYMLTELSVVDSPCNPIAEFSMIKGVGTSPELSDILVNTETVYYCETDEIAKAGESTCSVCGEEMQTIGFIESVDDFEVESVKKMITNHELNKADSAGNTSNEGPKTFDYTPGLPEDLRNAWVSFNQGMPTGYDPLRWAQIGSGIASAMSSATGVDHVYNVENGLVEVEGEDNAGEEKSEDGTVNVDANHPFPSTLKVAGAQTTKKVTKESNNLHNNENNVNVDYMELTSDQKESLLGKFARFLMFDKDSKSEIVKSAAEAVTQEEIMEDTQAAASEATTDEVAKSAPEGFDMGAFAAAVAAELKKGVEVFNQQPGDPTKTPGQDDAVGDAPMGWSNRLTEFGNTLRDVTASVDRMTKSVDSHSERLAALEEKVNGAGAVKKSVDAVHSVDEDEDTEIKKSQKSDSVWGNVFVSQNVLDALGYES